MSEHTITELLSPAFLSRMQNMWVMNMKAF